MLANGGKSGSTRARRAAAGGSSATLGTRAAGDSLLENQDHKSQQDPARRQGDIINQPIRGQEIRFFVTNPRDVIQSAHWQGRFYENEELEIISAFFPHGGVYADIGANVGNHTIFVCKFLHPSQAIVIEPNPPAIEILKINLLLNGLQDMVDMSWLGVGLAERPHKATAFIPPNNLGGTRMNIRHDDDSTAEHDGLTLVPGDDIFLQRRVDFIKMDIEGMELMALSGLAATIARWRPVMFIEVDKQNYAKFGDWLTRNDYRAEREYQRYPQNTNYLVLPMDAAPPP
jgi:FkbM family methyltransferase